MAKPKAKTEPTLRSASESQVAGMISKMFGVQPAEHLMEAFDLALEAHGADLIDLRHTFHLYPWECPVPQFVMSDKINTMVEDLAGSDGHPYIVRDSTAVGHLSLWVVRASFNDAPGTLPVWLPVRALVNHFLIGDEWLRVSAYQLVTCLRKLKNNPGR